MNRGCNQLDNPSSLYAVLSSRVLIDYSSRGCVRFLGRISKTTTLSELKINGLLLSCESCPFDFLLHQHVMYFLGLNCDSERVSKFCSGMAN